MKVVIVTLSLLRQKSCDNGTWKMFCHLRSICCISMDGKHGWEAWMTINMSFFTLVVFLLKKLQLRFRSSAELQRMEFLSALCTWQTAHILFRRQCTA